MSSPEWGEAGGPAAAGRRGAGGAFLLHSRQIQNPNPVAARGWKEELTFSGS